MVARPRTCARGRAQRRDRAARRRRLRAVRLLRLRHRDPDVRPSRRGRPALQQLPHHRAVLADARLPADRAQPPHQRHGAHRRTGRRLPRLRRDDPARERLPVRDPARQRLRHLRGRQVAPHAGHRDERTARRKDGGRSAAASSASTGSSAARPTSSTPTSSRQPPGRAAGDTRGGLPPHRGPGRHGDPVPQGPARTSPDEPFFCYFAPGACHAPHQAPASFIERYRGRFDEGWDAWREQVFARQMASGLLPSGNALSERPSWVPAWDRLLRRRAAPLRPHDGGVRRLPRRTPTRRSVDWSTSSRSSASSTTRS